MLVDRHEAYTVHIYMTISIDFDYYLEIKMIADVRKITILQPSLLLLVSEA